MINGVQTFMPRMIANGGGHIVNTASMSAFVALPTTAIYCTTKYAVRGLSESLRIELDKYNIGVSVLCPGGVNTNIHESVLARPEKYGQTGYYGADPEVFKRLKSVIEGGFDPVDLGRVVLRAVERNDFWILPYPEFIPTVEKNTEEVIAAMQMYEDDPDYARRRKAARGAGQGHARRPLIARRRRLPRTGRDPREMPIAPAPRFRASSQASNGRGATSPH